MSNQAEPHWLTVSRIRILHAETIRLFGGLPGVRDIGLLESAIDRPRNLHAYNPDLTLFDLAAAYAFGLTRNHPFSDGNKRASALAIRAFLFLNGWVFNPTQDEMAVMIEELAAGNVEERELSEWIKENCKLQRGKE